MNSNQFAQLVNSLADKARKEEQREGKFLIRTPKQDIIFVGRARTAESSALQQNVRVIPAKDND